MIDIPSLVTFDRFDDPRDHGIRIRATLPAFTVEGQVVKDSRLNEELVLRIKERMVLEIVNAVYGDLRNLAIEARGQYNAGRFGLLEQTLNRMCEKLEKP